MVPSYPGFLTINCCWLGATDRRTIDQSRSSAFRPQRSFEASIVKGRSWPEAVIWPQLTPHRHNIEFHPTRVSRRERTCWQEPTGYAAFIPRLAPSKVVVKILPQPAQNDRAGLALSGAPSSVWSERLFGEKRRLGVDTNCVCLHQAGKLYRAKPLSRRPGKVRLYGQATRKGWFATSTAEHPSSCALCLGHEAKRSDTGNAACCGGYHAAA